MRTFFQFTNLLKFYILITFFLLISSTVFSQKNKPEEVNFKKEFIHNKIKSHELILHDNKFSDSFVVTIYLHNAPHKMMTHQTAIMGMIFHQLNIKKKHATFYTNQDGEWTTIRLKGAYSDLASHLNEIHTTFQNTDLTEEEWISIKKDIITYRAQLKKSPVAIAEAMMYFARFGESNMYNTTISNDELDKWTKEDFIKHLSDVLRQQHIMTYFGPIKKDTQKIIKDHYTPLQTSYKKDKKETIQFKPLENMQNRVYLTHIDSEELMNLFWIKNNHNFNREDVYINNFFNKSYNNYIANALPLMSDMTMFNSISNIVLPLEQQRTSYTFNYLQFKSSHHQLDSIISHGLWLMNNFQSQEGYFIQTKNIMKEEYRHFNIYSEEFLDYYMYLRRLGIDEDIRHETDEYLSQLSNSQYAQYFKNNISQKPYVLCAIGTEEQLDKRIFQKYGVTKVVDLKTLFGY